jgi:Ni,Fe-hydrogenase III small subunit
VIEIMICPNCKKAEVEMVETVIRRYDTDEHGYKISKSRSESDFGILGVCTNGDCGATFLVNLDDNGGKNVI